jgi:hypothetical protein
MEHPPGKKGAVCCNEVLVTCNRRLVIPIRVHDTRWRPILQYLEKYVSCAESVPDISLTVSHVSMLIP